MATERSSFFLIFYFYSLFSIFIFHVLPGLEERVCEDSAELSCFGHKHPLQFLQF